MELAAGTVLDRYVVEGPLGEGGMAVVYRVRHERLGTVHALKLLNRSHRDLTRRLLREGRLQGSVKHPNVVSVMDIVEVGGVPGLVSELVEGCDLAALIRQGPLPLSVVDAVGRQVLHAMAEAHAQGVIHRDLKPSNVLLTQGPEGLLAKVSDFGLAKALQGPITGTPTQANMAMGTPGYMAPEQARDAGAVDARADVFALGALLFEMVTGRRAFPGTNALEALAAALRGRYEPVKSLRRDVPAWMEDAIDRALRPDPADRPADASALLRAWEGPLASAPPALVVLPPPVPPVAPAAPTRAWATESTVHPPRERLLDAPESPDVQAHLRACAACRIDVRLYAEAFADVSLAVGPEVRATARRRGLLAALAAVPLVVAVFWAVVGPPSMAGYFGFALVAVSAAVIGGLVAATTRALAGASVGIVGWSVGSALLLPLGDLGAVVGLHLVSGAVAEAPPVERARMLAAGLDVALSSAAFGHVGLFCGLGVALLGAARWRRAAPDPGREAVVWMLAGQLAAAALLLADVQLSRRALRAFKGADHGEAVGAAERFADALAAGPELLLAVGVVLLLTGAALMARRVPRWGRQLALCLAVWLPAALVGLPTMGLQRAMSAEVVPSALAVAVDAHAPGLQLEDVDATAAATGTTQVVAGGAWGLAGGDRIVALGGQSVGSVAAVVRALQACGCEVLDATVWRAGSGRIEGVRVPVTGAGETVRPPRPAAD